MLSEDFEQIAHTTPRPRLLPPLILVPVILLADQVSKALALANLAPGRPMEVIGDLLRFTLVQNPAIAFSIGHTLPPQVRRPLFLVLPLVVLVVIVIYYLRTGDLSRLQRWLLAAVLGGGLANFADRLFRPEGVVDFVDVKFYGLFGLERYPTFNVADSSVVVAGILLLVSFVSAEVAALRTSRHGHSAPPETRQADEPGSPPDADSDQ